MKKDLVLVNGFKDTKRIFFCISLFSADVSGPTESGGCHFFPLRMTQSARSMPSEASQVRQCLDMRWAAVEG